MLTAIAGPDDIYTKSFEPGEEKAAAEWVQQYNRKASYNIYFHVNLPPGKVTRKLKKSGVQAVSWLHVDVDARAGEPLDEEIQRIRTLLVDKCPVKQRPTVVVFSGGGYQAFWRLAEPIHLGCNLEKAEDAGRYNKQLELQLGGDNCHNVDRIMRLPGTRNIPNEQKRKKGRKEAEAEVVLFEDSSYDIATFEKAVVVQRKNAAVVHERVIDTGNLARFTVGDIKKKLNPKNDKDIEVALDRVLAILVSGKIPEEPKEKDNSDSAWVFDVVCNLLRLGADDTMVISILTDPEYWVNQHVARQKGDPVKYADRQVRNARDWVEEDDEERGNLLTELNEEWMWVVSYGNRSRVVGFDNESGRRQVVHLNPRDFEKSYNNHKLEIVIGQDAKGNDKIQKIGVGTWWANHEHRRTYSSIVFRPEGKVPFPATGKKDVYNLWQGFAYNMLPGDNHLSYLEHLRTNICKGNKEHANYLIGWLANCVQRPDIPGQTAIVLCGDQGTGKSFFVEHFGKLWGRHYTMVSQGEHLVGKFNQHLRDCVVCFGEEAFFAGDKKHESVLKALITSEHMVIEPKGVDSTVTSNFLHIIMASNEEKVVPGNKGERRYFVVDVGDERRLDRQYFGAIANDLRNGGYESLLHFLMGYDISNFDVTKVPQTEALGGQILKNLPIARKWWLSILEDGVIPTDEGWPEVVNRDNLLENYVAVCKNSHSRTTATAIEFAKFLRSVTDGKVTTDRVRRIPVVRLAPLAVCRQAWERMYPGTTWPTYDDDVTPSKPAF